MCVVVFGCALSMHCCLYMPQASKKQKKRGPSLKRLIYNEDPMGAVTEFLLLECDSDEIDYFKSLVKDG